MLKKQKEIFDDAIEILNKSNNDKELIYEAQKIFMQISDYPPAKSMIETCNHMMETDNKIDKKCFF